MPVLLSDRIQQMSESETLAMTRKSRELQAKGADVINLSLGEPDFNTPDFIKQAAKKAIDENYTYYMPVPGYLDLRQAISNKFKNENKLDYSPEQIVVSTGAKQSIANLVLCMVNSGDEVLLPAPYWVSYKEIVKLAGGIPVVIPSTFENDFKINAGILKKYITSKTKLFIFSTPCNPTGSVYSSDELKLLAEVFAANKQVTVIADEIYEYINFKGEHDSIAKYIYDQTVTVNGVSKGFSMTGWRIGYLGAPLEIAKACDKMQGQFTSGASGIAQRAAKAAIEAGKPATVEMCKAFLS
jgi:aspartate aminotransferase